MLLEYTLMYRLYFVSSFMISVFILDSVKDHEAKTVEISSDDTHSDETGDRGQHVQKSFIGAIGDRT